MAEDRYRLTPVRDARQRAEAVRRGDLADAVGDARATEAQLAATRTRAAAARDSLAAAVALRDPQLAAGTTPAALVVAERYVARRRHELAAAIAEELRAEATHGSQLGAVDLARSQLGRARAEREVIERHFAKWREAHRKLVERRED